MKILYVITRSCFGGVETIIINLSNQLCNDHEIVVAAGEDGPMWLALNGKVKKIKIKNLVHPIMPLKDIKVFFNLREIYQKEHPDIIHLFSGKAGVLGRLAFPSQKVIRSINGFDSFLLAYRKYLFIEKILKNRNKAIVVESNYDKQNLIKEGIKKNIHIVPNGVEPISTFPTVQINGLEKYDKVVMCIARVAPQKRFETFIEIARLLSYYAFVWIGVDKEYDDLPENLICLKEEIDAKKYIQLADIFVYPSNYEGMPVAIIDALSFGKPVVASNVGAISEIVVNGENGYTVENKAEIFSEKIIFILENEDIYKRFSENSLYRFKKDLTLEKMIKKYLEVYRS